MNYSKKNFFGVKNPVWWTQECPAVPQLSLGWMNGFRKVGRYFKKDYGAIVVPFKRDYGMHFLDITRSIDLGKELVQTFNSKPARILSIIRVWQSKRRVLLAKFLKVSDKNLKNTSTLNLWNVYSELFDAGIEVSAPAMVIESLEPYTTEIFYRQFSDWDKEKKKKLAILDYPEFSSFIAKQQLDLFKLMESVLLNRKSSKLVSSAKTTGKIAMELSKRFKRLYAEILKFRKKYEWIKNNYRDGESLTLPQVVEIIKAEIRGKSLAIVRNELSRLRPNYGKIKADKRKIIKSLRLPTECLKFYRLLNLIGPWHDERKRLALMYANRITTLLKTIGERTGYSLEELWYINPSELKALLSGKKVSRKLLKERRDFCVWIGTKNKEYWLRDIEAKRVMETVNSESEKELKVIAGLPASQGIARGLVRVVLDAQNDDFFDGEILVTPMTRPDFVPLMKKAKAIVTNEGGLTCHAAIVSRELGIPCVVGTKIATKIFKNGDEVEVRAHRGEIRLISRG